MRRRYVLWVVAALALVALVLILWGPDRSGLHARNPTEAGSSVAGPGRGVGLGGPLAVNSIGAARAQISGRVIDATGKGLAGASVCGTGTSVDLSSMLSVSPRAPPWPKAVPAETSAGAGPGNRC